MFNLKICFLINSASLSAPLDRHSAVWREAVQLCRSDHRPVAMVHFLRLWISTMGTGMMWLHSLASPSVGQTQKYGRTLPPCVGVGLVGVQLWQRGIVCSLVKLEILCSHLLQNPLHLKKTEKLVYILIIVKICFKESSTFRFDYYGIYKYIDSFFFLLQSQIIICYSVISESERFTNYFFF